MNAGIIIATWPMIIAGYIGGVSQMSSVWGDKGIAVIQVQKRSSFRMESKFWLL